MFNNLKIFYKQLAGFSIITILSLLTGFIGYSGIEGQKDVFSRISGSATLIDAVVAMKLSIIRETPVSMELATANSISGLEDAWGKHLALSRIFNTYTSAFLNGGETEKGRISAVENDALRTIFSTVDQFHKDNFQPAIKAIYDNRHSFLAVGYSTDLSTPALQEFRVEAITALQDARVDTIGKKISALLDEVKQRIESQVDISRKKALDKSKTAVLLILAAMLAVLCSSVLMAMVLSKELTTPIYKIVKYANEMVNGDFSQKLIFSHRKDEIGELVKALKRMNKAFMLIAADIANSVHTITSTSTQLSAISEQMNQSSEGAAVQCSTVASAAEQMSATMNNVAAASEQSSSNIQMVATAAEQMSATVSDIAKSSEQASSVTASAVNKASSTTNKVYDLGKSAIQISRVTEVITEISEQTNLLALNATIEAARAGEAGKGFAVVANEIKELAKQTAQATAEIKARIDDIQNATTATVTDIEEISRVINEVNEFVATIATAAEEQSVTTREIVSNITHASQGIQEVSENIGQTAEVSSEIAADISAMSQSNETLTSSSSQILSTSRELAKLAEHLSRITEEISMA